MPRHSLNNVSFALLSLCVLLCAPTAATAAAPDTAAKAIPWDQLGAKARADYQGEGLRVTPPAEEGRLHCVFQRLDGEATRQGLWLTSTVTNQAKDRFRVRAAAVGRSGDLYIGGGFSGVGDAIVNSVAKGNGNSWSPLGSGMNNSASGLAVSGSDLYAGGWFTTAGGKVSGCVAKAIAISGDWLRLQQRVPAPHTNRLNYSAYGLEMHYFEEGPTPHPGPLRCGRGEGESSAAKGAISSRTWY